MKKNKGIFLLLLIASRTLVNDNKAYALPTNISRENFLTLLNSVEKGGASSYLKAVYFNRRQDEGFPISERLSLIDEAIKKENMASQRWFFLQDVKAVGVLQTGAVDIKQGLSAFNLIFDNSSQAEAAHAQGVIQFACYEYVQYFIGKGRSLDGDAVSQANVTLTKDWSSYLKNYKYFGDKSALTPNFLSALDLPTISSDFSSVVEKSVNDGEAEQNFAALLTAAKVFSKSQPEKSIGWLRKSLLILPTRRTIQNTGNGTTIDSNQASVAFDLLVNLLASNHKLAEAISEQKNRITKLGNGQSKLLLLLLQSGDITAANELLKTLVLPATDQREIIRAADGLAELGSATENPLPNAKEKAVALLVAYLAADRVRLPDYELEARLRLGRYYVSMRQFDEARSAFKAGPFEAPLSSSARLSLKLIARDVDQLEKLAASVPPTTEESKSGNVGQAADRPALVDSVATASLRVGQKAPIFTAIDMNGTPQSLAQYAGKKNVLLTFFPKCFTGDCTNHLTSLRDTYPQLQANNTEVLAVSVDPAEGEQGQKAFAAKWKFPFPLIPDTSRSLSMLYGSARKITDLATRQSILIDKTGTIRWIEKHVNVTTHGADVLAKMKELGLAAK